MSYDPSDAAWDEAYERLSAELYPEHREQAISEFTTERLQSYYLQNPEITRPGFRMQGEARSLLDTHHYSASLVFAASAAEQFLKVALLRPVVYGLVHIEPLAEMVVESALSQTGYLRYTKLLSGLFGALTSVDLASLKRAGSAQALLTEASDLQNRRNAVVHRAEQVLEPEAVRALSVSAAVYLHVLTALLAAIGLQVVDGRVSKQGRV
jgi:hypothetical protein